MTDTKNSKRLWIPYYVTPAMLIFVIGLNLKNATEINTVGKDIVILETRTFDTVEDKVRSQDHVRNIPYSEMEVRKIVDHVNDSAVHISREEVLLIKKRISNMDSVSTIFMAEQWIQGQRLKRIETSINKLNNKP